MRRALEVVVIAAATLMAAGPAGAQPAATRNSLRALSEPSGGFALEEGQDLAATLARISDLVRQ